MSNNGFWDDLYSRKMPVVGLSPMDGVTDAAMRYMSAKYGGKYSSFPVTQFSSESPEHRITGIPGHQIGLDIIFTEFVSVDALKHASDPIKVDRVMRAFIRARDVNKYSSDTVTQLDSDTAAAPERWPYEVAQVFGHTPELFYQAAVMIATLGYDGMDINMGCPMHKVEDQGSGAGLIRTPKVAQEIVLASKRGMEDYAAGKVSVDDLDVSENVKKWVKGYASKYSSLPAQADNPVIQYSSKEREYRNTGTRVNQVLPVSVKTRIGVTHSVVEEWMATLMEVSPANISLHGRTLRQLYQGSADWGEIGKAAAVVHKLGGHLLGNGDITSIDDLRFKIEEYGVDGGLIGRAAEGNPAIFKYSSTPVVQLSSDQREHGNTGKRENVIRDQRLAWAVEHAKVYEKLFKDSSLPAHVGTPVIQLSSEIQEQGNTGTRDNDNRWFLPMRKHLAWYAHGFPGAVELRMQLIKTTSAADVEDVIARFTKN